VLDPVNEIDLIQVSLIRALASQHRLRIVHLLGARTMEVNELAGHLGLAQATVSQHLAAMRSVGLVEAARDGRVVRYRLADPEILAACDLMRDVIVRRLSVLGSLAAAEGRATQASAEPGRRGAARRGPTRRERGTRSNQPNQVTHR
jgi:ArsR family transcriptional regulator, virulence genes transcriptional regulator